MRFAVSKVDPSKDAESSNEEELPDYTENSDKEEEHDENLARNDKEDSEEEPACNDDRPAHGNEVSRDDKSAQDKQPADEIEVEEEDVCEVEKIVDKRRLKRGKGFATEYRVRWAGCGTDQDEWMNVKKLGDAMNLVQEYEAQVEGD